MRNFITWKIHLQRLVSILCKKRNFTITLPTPKEDITAADVETAMELILSKNIFTTAGRDITGKRDIKLVDTATTDLYDPAVS